MTTLLQPRSVVGSRSLQWAELTPDASQLIVGDFLLELWDLAGKVMHHFDVPGAIVWRARSTPDGRRIVSGHGDCKIRIWDRETTSLEHLIEQDEITTRLTLSADGQLALGASANKHLTLFEVETGVVRAHVRHKKSFSIGAALHPTGRLAAHAGTDGYFRVYDFEDEQERSATAGKGWVNDLAMSGDGSLFATGGRDKTVMLWNERGEHLRTLRGMSKAIQGVAVSPDGSRVAACGTRGDVFLWDPESGELVAKLAHDTEVRAVSFSSDGETIVTATSSGVRLFDTA
ncbi:MAG: hypothetical protein R3B72_19330 [Polyangiaceae bacterium]